MICIFQPPPTPGAARAIRYVDPFSPFDFAAAAEIIVCFD